MPIKQYQIENVLVVEIEGDISYDATLELATTLDSIIDNGTLRILIVPRDIEILNSMAVGVLFTRCTRLQECGGRMALAEVTEGLSKIFTATRFYRLVKGYPDIPSALQALQEEN